MFPVRGRSLRAVLNLFFDPSGFCRRCPMIDVCIDDELAVEGDLNQGFASNNDAVPFIAGLTTLTEGVAASYKAPQSWESISLLP